MVNAKFFVFFNTWVGVFGNAKSYRKYTQVEKEKVEFDDSTKCASELSARLRGIMPGRVERKIRRCFGERKMGGLSAILRARFKVT